MGKIPGYNRTQFGSSINRMDIQAAGQEYAQTGQLGQQVFQTGLALTQKKMQIDTQNFLARETLDFEEKIRQDYDQWKKDNQGNSEVDFRSFKETKFSEYKDQALSRAPNTMARNAFEQTAFRFEKNLEMDSNQWAVKRLAINTGEVAQEGLEKIQTAAYREANPMALDSLLEKSEIAIAPLESTHSPEQIAEARQRFRFNATVNSFEGLIHNGQIDEARQLLDSKKYDEHLGAGGIKRLEKQISIYERQSKKKSQQFERLKFSDPYKYLDKKGDGLASLGEEGFFSFNDPAGVEKRLSFIEEAQAANPGLKLPFFAKDEVETFKNQFQNADNKGRLNFLKKVEILPVDKIGFYDQMGVPREVGFFKNFENETDQELFLQASLASDIDPTTDNRISDIKADIEASDSYKALMSAAESMPANSAFRETVQNLGVTMQRVSILKNDPSAGSKFFEQNFETINEGDGFLGMTNENKIHAIIPKGQDLDKIEETIEANKQKLIESRVKGLSSRDAYMMRSNIEQNGIWVNSENGLVLIDRVTGKAYPGSMARISFNGNGQSRRVARGN